MRKTRRVTEWCLRFCYNALQQVHSHSRKSGPLKVTELEEANTHWVKREQKVVNINSKDAQQLRLTKCDDGIIRCVGRFSKDQPIFLPREFLYSHKVCVKAYKRVGHKSVNFVMGEVRNKYWILRLRTLAKSVTRECAPCKILTTKPYPVPNVGKLPAILITAKYLFAVTGIDFVGPFTLKEKKQELKAYVIVFSCATSRGVHFTTTRTMETSEFIARLNEFIAVRSCPQEIASDNPSTFKAAAAWKLMQSEELHEYLEYHSIKWVLFCSRAHGEEDSGKESTGI